MGEQNPYNKSTLNSIIISGKIVSDEQQFYQFLPDPIALVFEHVVRYFIYVFYIHINRIPWNNATYATNKLSQNPPIEIYKVLK